MRLYICSTYYHVYITLLKQFADPKDTDIVVCDDIPTGEKLTKRLSATGLFQHVWYVEQSKLPEVRGKNRLDWVLFQHRRRFRAIRPMLPFDLDDYQDIYIFHDGTPLGMYLADAKRPFHLIEDALNFYQRILDTSQAHHLKPHNLKYWGRRLLNSGYFPLGESRYVIDVEVNENKALQIELPYVKALPRRELQERLTDEEKQVLLELFGCPDFPEAEDTVTLLLTEPLFVDGRVESFEQQKTVYFQLIMEYVGTHETLVVKPHPRDTLNYAELFPDCMILDKNMPAEMFVCFMKSPFKRLVSFSSTALQTVPAKERVEIKLEKYKIV